VHFAYGALTRCGRMFQNRSAMHDLCNSLHALVRVLSVPRPRAGNATRLATSSV
jgi:hypothetical protein